MRQLTDLTEKSIGWFNDIADMCQRLTTGNVSHMSATIRGKAIRCAEFLNKHKEEPVTIWHNASERPQKVGDRVAWVNKRSGVMNTGWYNKDAFDHEDMRDPICRFSFDEISKWAYVDDLLSLTNKVTKMSEQEKPVNSELEEEIEKYMNHNYYIDEDCIVCDRNHPRLEFCEDKFKEVARHFANWQKHKDFKEFMKQQKRIDEAYRIGIDMGRIGMKQQMMKDAMTVQCFGFQCGEALFSIHLPAKDYLVGSEVKIIIIKEDRP